MQRYKKSIRNGKGFLGALVEKRALGFSLFGGDLEDDTERLVLVTGAGDVKRTYLSCGRYMLSYAGTDVKISYSYDTDGLAGILRQLVQSDTLWYALAIDILIGDRQVLSYELIHLPLYILDLLGSGFMVKSIVDFRLLAFYVSISGALAAEHSHHYLVEKMFGCM